MPAQALPKPYQYPKQKRHATTGRVTRPGFGQEEKEVLYRQVQGKTASDLEERTARALDKNPAWHGYEFQHTIISPKKTTGSITIDFWAYRADGTPVAIQVDGEWVHAQPATVKKDKEDRDRIDEYMQERGYEPCIVLPGHRLETQDDADQAINEIS